MSSGLEQFMTESRSSEERSSSVKIQLMQRIKKDTKIPDVANASDGMTQEAKCNSNFSLDRCIYKVIDSS